jgi:hypothetical protein
MGNLGSHDVDTFSRTHIVCNMGGTVHSYNVELIKSAQLVKYDIKRLIKSNIIIIKVTIIILA